MGAVTRGDVATGPVKHEGHRIVPWPVSLGPGKSHGDGPASRGDLLAPPAGLPSPAARGPPRVHATPPGARRTTVTGSGTPRPPRSPSLRMRVDGYVCVHTCVRACSYARSACADVSACACGRVTVCIQVSVCMYAHVLIRTCFCVHAYAYRCVSVCTYTHVHTQTCAHVGSCTCSHEIMNKGRGARAAPRSPHDGGHPPPQPRPSHPSDQNQRRPGKPSEGRPVPASSFAGRHCARCACPHM